MVRSSRFVVLMAAQRLSWQNIAFALRHRHPAMRTASNMRRSRDGDAVDVRHVCVACQDQQISI